jgi:hypothetical protein
VSRECLVEETPLESSVKKEVTCREVMKAAKAKWAVEGGVSAIAGSRREKHVVLAGEGATWRWGHPILTFNTHFYTHTQGG